MQTDYLVYYLVFALIELALASSLPHEATRGTCRHGRVVKWKVDNGNASDSNKTAMSADASEIQTALGAGPLLKATGTAAIRRLSHCSGLCSGGP